MTVSSLRFAVLALACLAAVSARAGDFADAFKAGDVTRAEAIRDQGGVTDDAADASAACDLLLFENRAPAAVDCYRPIADGASGGSRILSALGMAAFRAGDFHMAGDAFLHGHQGTLSIQANQLNALPAYQIAGDQASFAIPFVTTDPLPVVNVRLPDGRDHLFVVETGVPETILDPRLAKAIGINDIYALARSAFAGMRKPPPRYAVLPRLALGDLAIEQVGVQLLDISGFARLPDGGMIEGVIGVDLLRRFATTLDDPNHQLILRRQAPALSGGFPFWLAGDHEILATGAINGTKQLVVIDTSLPDQACLLPRSTLAQIGEDPGDAAPPPPGTPPGLRRPPQPVTVTAKTVTLGDATQADVVCEAGSFPPALEISTGARIGLLLSHPFLKRYAATFDFQAMRMTLQAPSATAGEGKSESNN
jgi:hypothetical protein